MNEISQSIHITINGISFIIRYDINYDVYNVVLTSPEFEENLTFTLINHHTNNIMSDIATQIIERICCESLHGVDREQQFVYKWFKENSLIFGLTENDIKKLYTYGQKCAYPTITPWLMDDYKSVLKTLEDLGYTVKFMPEHNHNGDIIDCYKVTYRNKTFVIPATKTLWLYDIDRKSKYNEKPFYSIYFILELIEEEIDYLFEQVTTNKSLQTN